MRALISIHDVMPDTLDRTQDIIQRLRDHGHTDITLLVVPGRDWSSDDVARLARWAGEGIELAAHGWQHRAKRIRGLWHRLHSRLISRDAAEHLSLNGEEIAALMRDSAQWFARQGLPLPTTYVPPAWALGAISREQLSALPFRQIEVTWGIIDAESGHLQPLPLVGFEADTWLRAAFLRHWNRFQVWRARRTGRHLRIGIHPYDPELLLAAELDGLIAEPWQSERTDGRGFLG